MANEQDLKLTGEEGDRAAAAPIAIPEVALTKEKDSLNCSSVPPPVHRRARITLTLKTTIILVVLLVGVVALCGGIFLKSAEKMLNANKTSQLSQFAYGLATAFGDMQEHGASVGFQIEALKQTPNMEFAVLTDTNMNKMAFVGSADVWNTYAASLGGGQYNISKHVGKVQLVEFAKTSAYVVTVPVFRISSKGPSTNIIGYLHVATSSEGIAAQLRFLQASVLLACMGVVLLIVPIAGFVARHITAPVQELAMAAHTLAEGDLSHRLLMRRSDEIGELAQAFNRMADTVQQQQEDIKEINAGLEQKVEERTAQLQQVNHKLTSEISEKEDFLRAVSHDLNAPLRNIAGMASMLVMKYGATMEKDALQRLERIQKNVAVETELINELLELSRIKTRREKIERVDLHELITAVSEGFASDLETRRIGLSINGRLPIMKCEKARMRQVFQNLIDNAIKYMREEGPRTITVGVRWEPEELVVSVCDTGMGIAADEIPHLFHVFRRAKNAAIMKIPGKGVGLASVKSIVENYHGRLWAESEPGVGTTFHMAIPRVHFELARQEVA
jgi:signal transduction histidine kinase